MYIYINVHIYIYMCAYKYIYIYLCVYTCIYGHPKVFINSCKGFAFIFSGSGQCAILLLSVQGMSSMHLPSWYLKSKLWSLVSEGLHCLGQLQLLHHTLKLEGAKRSFLASSSHPSLMMEDWASRCHVTPSLQL